MLARRDVPGKEGKAFVPRAGLVAQVHDLLEGIQKDLLARARAFRDENIRPAADWSELAAAVEQGFARAYWCGDDGCEARLKEIQASIRCIPFDQPGTGGRCALCGQEAREVAIIGRAY